jgi:predicted nucleic acid-binding protein
VLLVALRRGRITEKDRARIRDDLLALPIDIEPVSCERVWGAVLRVANQRNLSVYDAIYLELALRLKLPLATLDKTLAAAGRAAGVEAI